MSVRRWRRVTLVAITCIGVAHWAWSQQAPPATESIVVKPAAKPANNPIVGTGQQLPDYRNLLPDHTRPTDLADQRQSHLRPDRLSVFGYSFFEPARQVITARAAFLRRFLAQDILGPGVSGDIRPSMQPTLEHPSDAEVAMVAAMTDAQKADLRDRQRTGKLTDEEKLHYRWFLRTSDQTQTTPFDRSALQNPAATGDQAQLGDQWPGNLTEDQKANIRQRYLQNRLTPDEVRKYSSILPPGITPAPGVPGGVGGAEQGGFASGTRAQGGAMPGMPGWQDTRANQAYLPDVDVFRQIADPLATVLQRITPSAPTDYQVAGGDSLVVRYWSATMEPREERLIVDSSGAIDIPSVGRIVLRGQTTAQAEVALRERLRGFYRNVEVSVQLKELRTMPVVVNGESFFPGTYQVPAVTTAFNVLYATGGPTDEGSLRRIEVRRRGAVVATIDMYRFLVTGDQVDDMRLQPGDVLFIPPRGARVAVRGEVRRPGLYELGEKETLADAVRYAGGINSSGVAQRVQVTTVQPGATRVLKEVDWTRNGAGQSLALYDGDNVEVFSVRPVLANKVTIEGAVDQPGEYAVTDQMTVADIVERARGLVSDAYTIRADLYRVNADNTLALVPIDLEKALRRDPAANTVLSRWDRLRIYTRAEVAWAGRREVTVRGAVRNPGIYTRNENARVKDILQQAGGALPEAAEVVVLHQNNDRTYSYEYADVASVAKEDPKQNVLVHDQDILAVYRKDETRFTPEHVFQIEGEVTAPGSYPRGRGMRLSDALRLAGGLTPKAGTTARLASARMDAGPAPVVVTISANGDEPVPNPELNDGDIIAVQGRGTYQEKPWIVTVKGQVNKPGPVLVTSGSMRLSEAIKMAGGLKPDAYAPGASFDRQPDLLATAGQRQIVEVVSKLNDLLNKNEYMRALGRAEVERIRAIGAAAKSGSALAIPGLTATSDTGNSATAAVSTASKDRELVSPPRSLTASELLPKGNVAIDLVAALKKPMGDEDILVADGDVIEVPEHPTTVRVAGAVVDSRGVVFQPGAKLDFYITHAGGYAIDAARDRIVVIRLGGGLLPAKKVTALEPGDLIMVPTKVMAERFQSRTTEIDAFFRGLTSTAVIYKLAESVFKF